MSRKEHSCRTCGSWMPADDWVYQGRCASCRATRAQARRQKTAERALSRARNVGTVERDGQTFTVVKLPPKRK